MARLARLGGVTGTYYVAQAVDAERLIGVPRRSQLGAAPTAPGPHLYIDDTVNPDLLMLWDQSAGQYVAVAPTPLATSTSAGVVALAVAIQAVINAAPEALWMAATLAP